MRNLYSRLKVSPAASVEEIRSAIAACENASVRSDATEVLLSADRRRSYDRLHKVLVEIGQLRASLGLSHGDNWRGEAATDYTRPAVPPRSRYAEFTAKVENHAGRRVRRQAEQARQARAQKVRRAVGAGVGGIGVAAANLAKSVWELAVGLAKVAAVMTAMFGALYIVGTLVSENSRGGTVAREAPPPVAVAAPPAFRAPPVAMPYSGALRRFAPGEAIAPFEIQTSAGANYLVKLEDAYDGTDVMDIFVRGGDTIEVEVPLGTYVVKYASGTTWYGYDYRFGPETSYNKAETTFDFRNDGYQITGYTVTLYQVRDGNMQTRRLNAGEF
jgi:hypothetical protein